MTTTPTTEETAVGTATTIDRRTLNPIAADAIKALERVGVLPVVLAADHTYVTIRFRFDDLAAIGGKVSGLSDDEMDSLHADCVDEADHDLLIGTLRDAIADLDRFIGKADLTEAEAADLKTIADRLAEAAP